MIAAGIDVGGTKIEAQLFDADWAMSAQQRVQTPATYERLVEAIAGQIRWAQATNDQIPVGIGSAGLVNDSTGLALTANLPATGKPLVQDIEQAVGRPVCLLNDCRALTLSEAKFGAGRGASRLVGLILGTGIGGGVAIDGHLLGTPTSVSGEFGHIAAPASIVQEHDLPIIPCGCGRTGCIETYIAGPGLTRLAQSVAGRTLSPIEIATQRHTDPAVAAVWQIWCTFVAEMMLSIIYTVEPDVIVLGGGLSRIEGLTDDLQASLQDRQLPGFPIPAVRLAEGGDASGARGAAYYAWEEAQNG